MWTNWDAVLSGQAGGFGHIASAILVERVPDMPRLLPQIWHAEHANQLENAIFGTIKVVQKMQKLQTYS